MEKTFKTLENQARLQISRFLENNDKYKRHPLIVADEFDKLRIINTYLSDLTLQNLVFKDIPDLIERLLMDFTLSSQNTKRVRSLVDVCQQKDPTELELCLILYSILSPLGYCCTVSILESKDELKLEKENDFLANKYFAAEGEYSVKDFDISLFSSFLIVDNVNMQKTITAPPTKRESSRFRVYDVKTSQSFASSNKVLSQIVGFNAILLDTENIYTVVHDIDSQLLRLKPLFKASVEPFKDQENQEANNLAKRISQVSSKDQRKSVAQVSTTQNPAAPEEKSYLKDFPFYTFYNKADVEIAIDTLLSSVDILSHGYCVDNIEYKFFVNEPSGLKARRTKYMSNERILPYSIDNLYANRSDFLNYEQINLSTLKTTQHFSNKRQDQLKTYTTIPNLLRKVEFYLERNDNIMMHEELLKAKKINIIYFSRSTDTGEQRQIIRREVRLCTIGKKQKRKVSIARKSDNGIFRATLTRYNVEIEEVEEITDYYSLQSLNENEIEKVDFKLNESLIHVFYARKVGSVLRREMLLDKVMIGTAKVEFEEKSSHLSSFSSSVTGKTADEKHKKEFYKYEIDKENLKIWCLNEKESFLDIKDTQKALEYIFSNLNKSVFFIRNKLELSKELKTKREEEEIMRQSRTEQDLENTSNEYAIYLDPFLERRQYFINEREIVLQAREKCLNSYKEILLNRAKRLEDNLIEAKLKLEKLKEEEEGIARRGFQTKNISKETEESLTLKVASLELRIDQEERLSLENFRKFEEKLRLDKRLRILYSRI